MSDNKIYIAAGAILLGLGGYVLYSRLSDAFGDDGRLYTKFTVTPEFGASPLNVTLKNTSTGGGGIQSTEWDFDDGTIGTGNSVSHTYTELGNYIVKMTVEYKIGTVETKTNIVAVTGGEICTDLKAGFTYSPLDPESGEGVIFQDASIGSPNELTWIYGDGDSNTGLPGGQVGHVYYPNSDKDYTVTLLATRGNCTATTKIPIHISAPQSGTIDGNVYEYTDLAPIPGVTVTIQDKSATTDVNGYYIIEDLEIGTGYNIRFEKTGYVVAWKQITVKVGTGTVSSAALKRIGG